MRKKTVSNLFDTIFWYIVYMLPLIVWLLILARNNFDATYTLTYVFNSLGLNIVANNPIVTSLTGIVGVGGVFPIFASNDIIVFASWFIGTFLLHLLVDFLLFIPRLCHKWMGVFTDEK